MAEQPVEIVLKLDKSGIKRDLADMKRRVAEDREKGGGNLFSRPSSLPSFVQPSKAGSLGFGLDRPAFSGPSASLTLPKAAQAQIGKLIEGPAKKAVAEAAKGLDWKAVLQGFIKGGTTGAATAAAESGALGAAAQGVARGGLMGAAEGLVGTEVAAGLSLSGVAGGLGVAALVALAVKKAIDELDESGRFLTIVTGVLSDIMPGFKEIDAKVNEIAASMTEFSATFSLAALKKTVGQTVDLEQARLRLGENITAGQVGSDFEIIRKIEKNNEIQKRKTETQLKEEQWRGIVRSLAEGGK